MMRPRSVYVIAASFLILAATTGPSASTKPDPWNLTDLQNEAKAMSPSSIPTLRTRASGGDARSQFLLGLAYENGYGGISKDLDEALRWFKRAAEQRIGLAQAWVGDFYYEGTGRPVNFREAWNWYRLSSDNGYPWASVMIGYLYLAGQDVARDYSAARRSFQLAANRGDKLASKIMADLERNCSTRFCIDLQTLLVFGRHAGFKVLSSGEKDEFLYKTGVTQWKGKLLVDGATSCTVDESTKYMYTCGFLPFETRSITQTEVRSRFDKMVQAVLAAIQSGWRHDSTEGKGSLRFRIGPSLPSDGSQALVEVSAYWGGAKSGIMDQWEPIGDVKLQVRSRIPQR